VLAAVLVILWVAVGVVYDFPTWWATALYSGAASVTFVMVFVIQHTNERQTSAMQRKLDELIRSSAGADDSLVAVEEAPDDHLQALADAHVAIGEQMRE
jgi:low affinity Fe/Cu permease